MNHAGTATADAGDAALDALAKTVRFLGDFPGSPAARAALLNEFARGGANADGFGPAVQPIYTPDALGVWADGKVPSRITPTLLMLAWQRVLSEQYSASLLTFTPRIRTWCLRSLDRIGLRLDALKKSSAGGGLDAELRAERDRLLVMAEALRAAVVRCPGPTDRTAGLPAWLPTPDAATLAAENQVDRSAGALAVAAGVSPCWSNNLAAEQTWQALMILQDRLALTGEDRYKLAAVTIGTLLADRADFALLSDLNGWLAEYSSGLPTNDDFLSLAAAAQMPRDPDAQAVWKGKLHERFAARDRELKAAGLPAPADEDRCGEAWQLLPWRRGPLDEFAPLTRPAVPNPQLNTGGINEIAEPPSLASDATDTPLAAIHCESWADLNDTVADRAQGEVGAGGVLGGTQVSVVRAVGWLRAEPAAMQLAAWCLTEPTDFLRSSNDLTPLQDENSAGTIWIDGRAAFYRALAAAARAHVEYLRGLSLDPTNAAAFAGICSDLAHLRGALEADMLRQKLAPPAAGLPPAPPTRTRTQVEALAHAREWLREWLTIDGRGPRLPRWVAVPVGRLYWQDAKGRKVKWSPMPADEAGALLNNRLNRLAWLPGVGPWDGWVRLNWVDGYAVRPFSAGGALDEDNGTAPTLTVGLEVTLQPSGAPAVANRWTVPELQAAALGVKGQGPVRWFEVLDPPTGAEAGDAFGDLEALGAATRHAALEWLNRDPAAFTAAVAANPDPHGDDEAAWVEALCAHAPDADLSLVRELLENLPNETGAVLRGLSRAGRGMEVLNWLKKVPTPSAAEVADAAAAVGALTVDASTQHAFLIWLRAQSSADSHRAALAAFAAVAHPAAAGDFADWLKHSDDPTTRALLLANLGAALAAPPAAFRDRMREALQLQPAWEPDGIFAACGRPPLGEPGAIDGLQAALADPALAASALAALALTNRADAYTVLAPYFTGAQAGAVPFDGAFAVLLGTSRVQGDPPEFGRELLRAWIRRPVLDTDGKPRHATADENQAWARAVDILHREYLLTDEDLPAIVDRYLDEVGADVQAPRMHLATHPAFATAFAIDPEAVLDRLAAALASNDDFQRDAALAAFNTQTRVDALDADRPADLPALADLPLRLESVCAADRSALAAAWLRWIHARRSAILHAMHQHLD